MAALFSISSVTKREELRKPMYSPNLTVNLISDSVLLFLSGIFWTMLTFLHISPRALLPMALAELQGLGKSCQSRNVRHQRWKFIFLAMIPSNQSVDTEDDCHDGGKQ